MQEIEGVKGNHVMWVGCSILKRLKRWVAACVDGDKFTIEDGLPCFQPLAGGSNGWIGMREVLVMPGANAHPVTVLQEQRAVAVELHLVQPLVTLRQLVDDAGGHG
jgi:hypothetical protein